MNKEDYFKIISLLMSFNVDEYALDMIFDDKVNDCLMKLYFSILSNKTEERDKYYKEFEKKYNELNDEQKELAKIEIAKILKIDYKPKTKKKER